MLVPLTLAPAPALVLSILHFPQLSIMRRLPNIEIASVSVNKVSTLAYFAECTKLKELYLRKNSIEDLATVGHLRVHTNSNHQQLPFSLTRMWRVMAAPAAPQCALASGQSMRRDAALSRLCHYHAASAAQA